MTNKIEQFLQEIHALPDENIDKVKLESTLNALISARPDIAADDAFKHKLRTRLSNIIEFKQSNTHVKRIGYLKILLPIFACFIFIVGIFSIIDIKLPGQGGDYMPPTVSENVTIIDPDLAPEEVANQIAQEEVQKKQLSKKQQILEKSRLKKLAEQDNNPPEPLSDDEVFGEQAIPVVEQQLEGQISIPAEKSSGLIDTSITDILGEIETTEENEQQASDLDDELMRDFEEERDEDYDSFELFCKDNLGDILEGEEERSCDLGGGKVCSETQINENTCEIE